MKGPVGSGHPNFSGGLPAGLDHKVPKILPSALFTHLFQISILVLPIFPWIFGQSTFRFRFNSCIVQVANYSVWLCESRDHGTPDEDGWD